MISLPVSWVETRRSRDSRTRISEPTMPSTSTFVLSMSMARTPSRPSSWSRS